MESHNELLHAINVINTMFGDCPLEFLKQIFTLVQAHSQNKEYFQALMATPDEECRGRTPLIKALRNGHLKLAKTLVEMLDTLDTFTIQSSEFMGKECYICYEPFEESHIVYRLPCGGHHIFHKHCIDKWVTINSTCPYCRDHVSIMTSSNILNQRSESQKTALYYAIQQGDLSLIETLVEKGALVLYNDASILHLAAGFSHPEIVRSFVSKGQNIEGKDMDGHTPLYYAARYADAPTNQLLLDLSASPFFSYYCEYEDGRVNTTALHIACAEGNMKCIPFYIQYFKDKQISLDSRNSRGNTPLIEAIKHTHEEVVEELLHAEVDLSDFSDNHPIFHAFHKYGNYSSESEASRILYSLMDIVKEQFSDVKKEEYRLLLSKLLKKACMRNIPDFFIKLLQSYDLEIFPECYNVLAMPNYISLLVKTNNIDKILDKTEFFFNCIKYDNLEAVQLYIEKGHDIHVRDKDNNAAAHFIKSLEMAEVLDTHNLEIHVVNNKGETPLHAFFHTHETLKYQTLSYEPLERTSRYPHLLRPLEDDDDEDIEPVPAPVRRNIVAVRRVVVPYRRVVPRNRPVTNVVENDEEVAPPPPPVKKVMRGIPKYPPHEHVLEFFLEKGIDINAKTNTGMTALQMASFKNSKFYIRLLVKHGANVNEHSSFKSAAHIAMINDYKESIEELVEQGADIHALYDDETMLHYAVNSGFKGLVKTLIEKGVSLDMRNKRGETVLGLSIFQRGAMLEILLEQGVNLQTLVHTNETIPQTPIGYATFLGHMSTVETLLEKGADINQKEVTGKTPILIAAEKQHSSLIQYFLSKNCSLDFLSWEVTETTDQGVEEAEIEDDTDLPGTIVEHFIEKTEFPPNAKQIRIFQSHEKK